MSEASVIEVPTLLDAEAMALRDVLLRTACKEELIQYQVAVGAAGLKYNVQRVQQRLHVGHLLGQIATFEHENKRPLLPAVVVRKKDEEPGAGFIAIAGRLGVFKPEHPFDVDIDAFIMHETKQVWRYWRTWWLRL